MALRSSPSPSSSTAPARASDAHIAVAGHITAAELRHHLTAIELANGLATGFC